MTIISHRPEDGGPVAGSVGVVVVVSIRVVVTQAPGMVQSSVVIDREVRVGGVTVSIDIVVTPPDPVTLEVLSVVDEFVDTSVGRSSPSDPLQAAIIIRPRSPPHVAAQIPAMRLSIGRLLDSPVAGR